MNSTMNRSSWASSLRVNVRSLLTPRRLATLTLLVSAWCALWGSVSVANVLSGTLIAVAATLSSGVDRTTGGLRIVPLLHFVWLVAVDLVVSRASVAWEVLTPGAAVIDSDADTCRLYLHLLHAEKAPGIEQHVRRLAELACRALPVNEEVAP